MEDLEKVIKDGWMDCRYCVFVGKELCENRERERSPVAMDFFLMPRFCAVPEALRMPANAPEADSCSCWSVNAEKTSPPRMIFLAIQKYMIESVAVGMT